METPLVPEILLQHGQFVQSLARSLLHDAHQAEDVAQEAWTRFVERGPRAERSVRTWLRTVTRNLAFNAQRRERTRREHVLRERQEHAARLEAVPSAAEELAQGECLRHVIEAVLALDEPYRATILARYYQGRDLRRIAEETQTPLATVRSREQRALELLRGRLDRDVGGERASWALVLARLTGPAPGAAAATGALATGTFASGGLVTAAWLAVGVAAVGFVWGVVRDRGEPVAAEPEPEPKLVRVLPSESSAPVASPAGALPARETRSAAQEGSTAARTSARTEPAGSSGTSSALEAQLAVIRGRFVLPGGAPAAGVAVHVRGWGANSERELQYGEPESWQDPSTTTDADGRFALRFEPPRAYQFVLDASFPPHAGASWRWYELLPGSTTDVGEVELPLGGIIEGRIVDRAGNEVPGDWRVYADSIGLGRRDGRDETNVSAPVEPGTGRFRLVDAWPGPVELKAYSRLTNWLRGTRIIAVSGEVVTADLVYSGPDNSRRITVTTTSRPFHVMGMPDEAALQLSGPGVAPRASRKVEGSAQTYSFEDLAPGAYSIELIDPRCVPWRQDGVLPGTEVTARLEGNSALSLDVRGPDGTPLERYEVRVAFRNVNFTPREFRVHDGREPLAGGLVHGMFAGDYTVTVLAEGLGSRAAEVEWLAPGETRGVRLELGAVTTAVGTVGGRVVHPDGAPVAGAEVVLLAPAEVDDSPASRVLRSGTFTGDPQLWRKELEVSVSDAAGGFSFDLSRSGSYALHAALGPVLSVSSNRFEVPPAETEAALELVLPRGGRVQGRLVGPDEVGLTGLRLWAIPAIADFSVIGFDQARATMVAVSADGTYAIGPLPQGDYRVFLLLPESTDELVMRTTERVAGGLELGAVQVLEGEIVRADFDVSDRLPGDVVLTVLVNGTPASGVDVTLRSLEPGDPTQLRAVTGANGTTAPVKAFAGVYRVYARDGRAGWSESSAEQVSVASAASTQRTLTLTVAPGTLMCAQADGQPLTNEWVTVLRASDMPFQPWEQVTTRQTDGEGRLELALTPGEYALQRGKFRPFEPPATVPLTWTTDGPRDTHVQL